MSSHTRRAVLATLTTVGLAGCATRGDSDSSSENELPYNCPTSLNLDVEWPRDLDRASVEQFVTAYEEAYLTRDVSKYDSASINVDVDSPKKISDGFNVPVSFKGGIKHNDMFLDAFEVDSDGIPKDEDMIDVSKNELPANPEYVPIDEIEDQNLRQILTSAAESGIGEGQINYPSEMDRYLELISELPSDVSFDDEFKTGAYFDVDGSPVLLVISIGHSATSDYYGTAQYHVTEHVVRRLDAEDPKKDGSPQDGTVVECRPPPPQ